MSGWRILAVEDHRPLLLAIQDILEAEGYTVYTATDGERALRVMKEVRPDLIMADVMMPQMDGYALREAVCAFPEWASIPFVFLTAKAEKEDLLKARELGVEHYVTKPFTPQELVAAVRASLGQSRWSTF